MLHWLHYDVGRRKSFRHVSRNGSILLSNHWGNCNAALKEIYYLSPFPRLTFMRVLVDTLGNRRKNHNDSWLLMMHYVEIVLIFCRQIIRTEKKKNNTEFLFRKLVFFNQSYQYFNFRLDIAYQSSWRIFMLEKV